VIDVIAVFTWLALMITYSEHLRGLSDLAVVAVIVWALISCLSVGFAIKRFGRYVAAVLSTGGRG
jgi:hypothetical protein